MATTLDVKQLLADGKFPEAISNLEALLSDEPDNQSHLRAYAYALAHSGRLSEAMAPARRAAKLQPGLVENRFLLGAVLVQAGRFNEGISELEAAITLDPNHVDAGKTLVDALLTAANRAPDPSNAEKLLSKAQRLDPKRLDVSVARIAATLRNGNVGGAKALFMSTQAQHADEATFFSMLREAGVDPKNLIPPSIPIPPVNEAFLAPKAPIEEPKQTKVSCPNCHQPIEPSSPACPYCRFMLGPGILGGTSESVKADAQLGMASSFWIVSFAALAALGFGIFGGAGNLILAVSAGVRLILGFGLASKSVSMNRFAKPVIFMGIAADLVLLFTVFPTQNAALILASFLSMGLSGMMLCCMSKSNG